MEKLFENSLRILEASIQGIEEIHANVMERNGAIFTDDQVRKIKELFDERAEVHAGRVAFRAVLWAIGAMAAGAASSVLIFFRLK